MIDSTKPEFVIALGRHVDMPEIARHLINVGIPFLMEKPMGTTAAAVAEIADLAEQRNAWVTVPAEAVGFYCCAEVPKRAR